MLSIIRKLSCLSIGIIISSWVSVGWVVDLRQANAQIGDFTTRLESTYVIDEAGDATVLKRFSIRNNTSLHYISDYQITLGSTSIGDIEAYSDQESNIPVQIVSRENTTTIRLDFSEPVVGLGNEKEFTLRYTNNDITQLVGRVLELNIPKLYDTTFIDDYRVIIRVPVEFGQPTAVNPSTKRISSDQNYTIVEYAHKQANNESIAIMFGEYQLFDLSLRYNLENPTITPIITQIALPPDTAYQKMYYHRIVPKPESVELDSDGNWIATYELEPRARTVVTVTASVQTFIEPMMPAARDFDNLEPYLASQPYWPVDNPRVVALAKELETAENIYQFLVENLTYDYSRVDHATTSRMGGLWILDNPQHALCLEFTDAFISLARAAGIPARLLTGYAYTQNELLRPRSLLQEVLHAWPEYFDVEQEKWIPIDPTWGHTTGGIDYFNQLDFNHIVFAIQGLSSERPYPAGYYKFEAQESRDVLVSYNNQSPEELVQIYAQAQKPFWTQLGLSNSYDILLTSQSNVALYDLNFEILSEDATFETEAYVPVLIPFGSASFRTNISIDGNGKTIRLNDVKWQQPIDLSRNVYGLYFLTAIVIITGAGIIYKRST